MQISFKKITASLLFGIFILSVPLFIFPKLPKNSVHFEPVEFKGVLTLWHIDTFEGGSGSRLEFLKGRAVEFEKSNKGMLISIQAFTAEQVKDKLKNGETFDLISFSGGLGEELRSILSVYGGAVNVRDDLLESGKLNGSILGLPWTFGGYMLAAYDDNLSLTGNNTLKLENAFSYSVSKKLGKTQKQIYSLGTGFGGFNNPFEALAVNNVKATGEFGWNGNYGITQYEAYENYLSGNNFTVLLGTQRDLSRFLVRENNGKLKPSQFVFLGGYTDIIQYIGFSANDSVKKQICVSFIEYLTSDTVQQKLSKIELFSVNGASIFTQGLHKEMEKALSSKLAVPNVFTDSQILIGNRRASFEKLKTV